MSGPPSIEVRTEEETAHGWRYHVFIDGGRGPVEHIVLLSWVDHEHWSGGRHPPSRVVETIVRLLLEHGAERPIPPTFDAATVRRWLPGLDAAMAQRL
ncbi:MAG: hypothetical protein WD749_09550 [Phycisphaerales bacterium]